MILPPPPDDCCWDASTVADSQRSRRRRTLHPQARVTALSAGVVWNNSQCQITRICAIARARSCKVSYAGVSFTVWVRIKVRVLGLGLVVGLGLKIPTSCKSRTVSYLAMRHIWHDTCMSFPLPANRQHQIYDVYLEVKRKIYHNVPCCVLYNSCTLWLVVWHSNSIICYYQLR